MLSHRVDHGVLVLTVQEDPGIGGRAELTSGITAFVRAYQPAPVLVVIEEPAATPATASAVLRAHRHCDELGVLMSVATHSAPVRRLLEANACSGGTRLVVHPCIDTAVGSVYQTAA
ncbi:hypothetical protein [Streptomyces atroolivaceus]|uniref:hypothetical protein n=1 Tax=Streptomyces atroolivaceus TaxID=66869 RepID=UPI0037B35403